MAYRLPSYLRRNRHGVLYFRLAVPADIQPLIGRKEIYRSLGVAGVRDAASASQALRIAFGAVFDKLRTMTMPDDKKTPQAAWDDFVNAPDLRMRIAKAGAKIALEEAQQRADMLESEIVNLNHTHARELEIALRAVSNSPAPKPAGILFEDAVSRYFSENERIKANTRATYKSKLDHAKAHFGADADIRGIEQAAFSAYARHAAKSIGDRVTAGGYIATVATFLNWFRAQEGWGALLTTKTLIPKKTTPDTEDRDGFTVEQLGVLFNNAARYRTKQPYKFWATITPAFTGCRIEELAQLNLETDLRHDSQSGVWYLDLNESPDGDGVVRKSLKNRSSWRTVPIHSALVAGGFIEYLEQQKSNGFSRPFESGWKPRIYDDGKGLKWGHFVVNWGGRELGALVKRGLLARGRLTYYHSQRHTFSGTLRQSGVSIDVQEALMGHKYGGDGEAARYSKLQKDFVMLSRDGIEKGLAPVARLFEQI